MTVSKSPKATLSSAKNARRPTAEKEVSPATRSDGSFAFASRSLSPVPEEFEHLAEVQLWTDKNVIDGAMPINLNVKIGPIEIDSGGVHYLLYIRQAFLQLKCDGFRKSISSRDYKRSLDKHDAEANVQRIMREESNTSWKVKVGTRFGFSQAIFDADAQKGRKRGATSQTTTNSKLEMILIQTLPNLRWRLGDGQLGDLRKLQGFLDGDYFYHDCPEKLPLCEMVATRNTGNGWIRATLIVSLKEGVHAVREGDYLSAAPILDSERDGPFAEAFKDRLRALALAPFCVGNALTIAKGQLSISEGSNAA